MTAPVIRGTCPLGGTWTTAPQSGDLLIAVVAFPSSASDNYAVTFNTPSGWTVYSGLNNTSNGRVFTKTAGSSESNITSTQFGTADTYNFFGISRGLLGTVFAFSNGASTSIDYAAGGSWNGVGNNVDNYPPTAPQPKNNQTLDTSDGLLISIATASAEGFSGDWGDAGFPGSSSMSVASGMTSLSSSAIYDEQFGIYYDGSTYGAAFLSVIVAYQQLSSTTNPGTRTFNYLSWYGANGSYSAGSIVVKVGSESSLTAYGPSIRR